MHYHFYNIEVEDFAITAARAPGSNIAVSGFLDFPRRIEKAFHQWPDEDGVQPWLHADLMHYGGRDIDFYGIANVGSLAVLQQGVANFKAAVKAEEAANGLTTFETLWSTHNVYLRGELEITRLIDGVATIKIPFREPYPDLSGVVPAEVPGNNLGIEKIPWNTLGIIPLELAGRFNMAGLQQMSASVYGKEAYESVAHGANLRTFKGVLNYPNMAALVAGCSTLYAILQQAKLLRLKLFSDDESRTFFNTEGFTVRNIMVESNRVTALIEMTIIEDSVVEDIVSDWLIYSGVWNDTLFWRDNEYWIDNP